ncbi:MAG TPA: hypothetical protein VG944_23560, partial [Fimbriimonas sp.]|nr:hypothetical protein [Fimbriimonas sp.]
MLRSTLIVLTIGACAASLIASRTTRRASGDETQKTTDQQVDAGEAKRLDVNLPIGNVVLVADGSKELSVHAVRSARGEKDEWSQKWLRDSYLTVENRDGVLTVWDHPFGRDSLKDEAKGGHDNGRNLELRVEIHAPNSLSAKLAVTAGKALVRGEFQSVDAALTAGEMIYEANCREKAALHVGAGALAAHFTKEMGSPSILRMGAGEVIVSVPSGGDADISADVTIGEIKGLPPREKPRNEMRLGDKRSGRLGRGGARVDIHVATGSAEIRSAETPQSVSLSPLLAEPGDNSDDGALDLDETIDGAVSKSLQEAMKALGSIHTGSRLDGEPGASI